MTAVPLIDLTPWYAGSPAGRRQVATDVDRGLCEVGLLLVTGHPGSAGPADRLRDEVGSFFALPTTEKAELACFPGGRGWIPPDPAVASGGPVPPPAAGESFGFGPEEVPPELAGTAEEEWFGPNSWPADRPGLSAVATAYAAGCAPLAEDLLRVLALALDLADDFFVSRCSGSTWRVDLEAHPARQLRVAEHTDAGTLTLRDSPPGLQVRTVDGEWVDVPVRPGALAVTAGDLLARWTGDRWRSTPHRVLARPDELPTEQLLSLVYAHEADPLTVVERLPTAAAGPTRYEPVTAGRFRRERMDTVTVG